MCANPLDLEEFSGTIGYPMPSTDVSIRLADGAWCRSGSGANYASKVRR